MSRKVTSSTKPYPDSASKPGCLSHVSGSTADLLPSEKCSDKTYSDSGVFSAEILSEEITSAEDNSCSFTKDLPDHSEDRGKIKPSFDHGGKSENINYVDSGVCSGSNIDSMKDLSDSDHSAPMRFDSGIGDSVSQQFGELNLKESGSSDDLLSKRFTKLSTNVNQKSIDQKPQEQLSSILSYFQQNEDGDTQLHIAIMERYIEVIHALVRLAPDPKYLNIWNHDRQTPLHLAVLTNQPYIVRMLVCAGASLDILDRYGNTPLHLAVQADNLVCVQCIMSSITVEETARFQLQYPPYPFHSKTNVAHVTNLYNYDGQTCVHLAALNGNVEIMRHLMWCGADINAKEWKGGQTSLHIAVENKDIRLCEFLLKDAKINAEEVTYAGYTAYQTSFGWDAKISDILRRHGVDPYLSSDSESDSDDDMLEISANGLMAGVHMNGAGWINVGA